jgi:competence protein ComEA
LEDLAAATLRHGGRHPGVDQNHSISRMNRIGTILADVPVQKEAHMESSSSNGKQSVGTLIKRIAARLRGSAWTPLIIKVAAGVFGFFALAFVGSGAAADLLPGRAGTYLGPPTVPSAVPAASVATPIVEASAHVPPVASGQTPDAGDAGVPSAAATPPTTESAVTADGKVILNLATEDDLRKLPGIGPKKAQAILVLRTKLGKFKRAEDLLRVKGIGRKKLAKLRPRLLIDPPDKP